jgi:hypothetical protein
MLLTLISVIVLVSYFAVGGLTTLITERDSYLIFWPILIPWNILCWALKGFMHIPKLIRKSVKEYQAKREKQKEVEKLKNKPSYILAGTIASLILRNFQNITERPLGRRITIHSFQEDDIQVIRTTTDHAYHGSIRKPIDIGWKLLIGEEAYPFERLERLLIIEAFEEALKWKDQLKLSQREANRQNLAISHIEQFMGVRN